MTQSAINFNKTWLNKADVVFCQNEDFASFAFYMNLETFWHKDHSCIIFHSRIMIKFRLFHGDTGDSKLQDISTSKFFLLTCQWYKNKNKCFQPHILQYWVMGVVELYAKDHLETSLGIWQILNLMHICDVIWLNSPHGETLTFWVFSII